MLSNFAAVDNYNFSGGNITSDSGALLFARFIHSLSLHDAFRSLPFDDDRKNPVHSYSDILLGQIFKFMLGYFRQADQLVLRQDPFLLKAWAYNIYHLFLNRKAKHMPGIARMRMNTFRKGFIKIGGKVIRHARQITLCISSAYARKKEFAGLMYNIQNE